MKKAAIDIGIKRTGLAFTDPEERIVSKVKTIETKDLEHEISKNLPLSEIIIGLPVNLKNQFTRSTYMAVDRAIEIAKEFSPVPVYLMDERYTTKMASTIESKTIIDGISASILLEERLNGAKGTRVFWSMPFVSNEIVEFLSSLGRTVCVIGGDLRGIEFRKQNLRFLIFEDDPVFFVLRSKCGNCTLHFGINWDIILQNADNVDLAICSEEYLEKAKEIFPERVFVVSEGRENEGLFVGGRWIRIERIKK